MTQLQPHKNLYAIKVPLDAKDYDLGVNSIHFKVSPHSKGYNSMAELQGFLQTYIEVFKQDEDNLSNWQILGEVTKDSISFYVEPFVRITEDKFGWVDYKKEWFYLETADKSFYSLLAANGVFFENPIESPVEKALLKKYEYVASYHEDLERWQSHQDKLVKKVLIIEKI